MTIFKISDLWHKFTCQSETKYKSCQYFFENIKTTMLLDSICRLNLIEMIAEFCFIMKFFFNFTTYSNDWTS